MRAHESAPRPLSIAVVAAGIPRRPRARARALIGAAAAVLGLGASGGGKAASLTGVANVVQPGYHRHHHRHHRRDPMSPGETCGVRDHFYGRGQRRRFAKGRYQQLQAQGFRFLSRHAIRRCKMRVEIAAEYTDKTDVAFAAAAIKHHGLGKAYELLIADPRAKKSR